jgi:hypothetical protein
MPTYKISREPVEGWYELRNIPPGSFIKRKPTSKKVYIRGEYDKGSKTYSVWEYEDMNNEIFLKGSTKVYAGFIY